MAKMTRFLVSSSGFSMPERTFRREPIQIPRQVPGKTPTKVAQTSVKSEIEVTEKK
jgi:hypothetical protein